MTTPETYRSLAGRFETVLDAVPDDRWHDPSPCDGWTAADVVDHVVGTEREILTRLGLDAPDTEGLDRVDAWRMVRKAMQAALDGPDAAREYDGHLGRTNFSATVDQFYAPDLVIHRWDLARATGQSDHEAIDDDEIALVRAAWEPLGGNLRAPGVLGDEVDVPSDADPSTKLLAFSGRRA